MSECKEVIELLSAIETYSLSLTQYLDQILDLARDCAEFTTSADIATPSRKIGLIFSGGLVGLMVGFLIWLIGGIQRV